MRTNRSRPEDSWQKRIGLCPDDGWQKVMKHLPSIEANPPKNAEKSSRAPSSENDGVSTATGPTPHFMTHACHDSFDCDSHARNDGPDSQEDPDFGVRRGNEEDAFLISNETSYS